MKKLKIGKSSIHGKGLFSGELIKKGELIAKVHNGIQLDPETVKYMPTQYGRFYNHDEKGFNTRNEIIGNHRYLRALKNIPANTELTANYREHPEMEQPEEFGKGKYASFDFDKTIATDEGLAKARKMIQEGYNLFIISARDKVTPDMVARARKAGIPEENIIATGSDEAKVRKVKQLGVEMHFDDKPEVISQLGTVGVQFAKKGGSVNSKRYTRNLLGKNKLFVKNNLFKTRSPKNRIYDPNAKYFNDGGPTYNDASKSIVAKPLWYQEPVVNPAAYVSGFRGGDPNIYNYGFLTTDRGNIVGGGGLGFPKSGIELSGLGVVPTSPDERQYFKGFYDAKISKDINKNINLGLGAGAAITGYPGENGFVMDPIKFQPNVSLKYKFDDGGLVDDPSIPRLNQFNNGGPTSNVSEVPLAAEDRCEEGYAWDDIAQKCVEIPDMKEWFTNWYSNRTLPLDEIQNKKYVALMKERLPMYNPDSPLLDRISELPDPTYVNLIDNNPRNRGQIVYDKDWNPSGMLVKQSLKGDAKELGRTMVHEDSTIIDDPDSEKLYPAQNAVIDPGLVLFKNRWGDLEGKERAEAEEYYDYQTDPALDNIHSMIFEERFARGLKPDQVITVEDIENWKREAEERGELNKESKNFNNALYSLLKLSKDSKSLANWFNQLASNEMPVDENAPQYAKQGGSIGYQLGDEVDEATMRKLKKLGYTFKKL
jgi:hypothetical protein